MCDIIVSDPSFIWDKGSPCERKGKYIVEVENTNPYDETKGEHFQIKVCGQHKNMLERGRYLDIKHLGKKYLVKTEVSAIGHAEAAVGHAEFEYESMRRALKNRRASIGEAADFSFDRLLEVTDGDPELRDFVEVLLSYRETKNSVAEYRQKLTEAEVEVERLKALDKPS